MRQAILAALNEHDMKARANVSIWIEALAFALKGVEDDHYLLHPL